MRKNSFQSLALTSIVSANLAGGAILGIFAGKSLDQWLNTKPIFTIIGLLIGLAMGVYGLVLSIKKFTR